MQSIYESICAQGILTSAHRKELKEKRGFTDETIAKFRFFSGGEYLLKMEAELQSAFTKEDLLKSGICNDTHGNLTLSDQLIGNNIIIPYLDKEGKAILLRAHKYGFSGVPIQVYQEFNLTGHNIILTEGEFKAAAACQLGLPAIAVPGISSFVKDYFPELVKLLFKHNVRDVCVIFDNEIKDNPSLKNYKQKPADRYDTQYYSYLMAKKLEDENFRTRIAVLPAGWMTDGKIDIDGALAQGRTKDDFQHIISLSRTHKEFLEGLETEGRNIVLKKREASYFRSHIKVNFGQYEAIRKKGKIEISEIISNFTLKIAATHETPDGMMRAVLLRNKFGETSRISMLTPEDMSTMTFKTFCFAQGNYLWEGTQEDLNAIWRHEFLHDDGKHIVEPGSVGWIEDMWLFGNVAIKDGKEMRPDESGIFWTEKKGYKPIPLSEDASVPYFSRQAPELPDILQKLSDTIGQEEAKLSLGWVFAVAYLEDVFKVYNCFPFLFLTGKKGSGKSHIADWLMSFWGMERSGKQAADSTSVGLQRCLEYYSSMPVFIDEYKNTQKITQKNGFFRNCYNRQSASKGIKSNFGVRSAKIKGTLLFAGEETPEDPALLSRCIPILITLKRRQNNHYDWFQGKVNEFSAHIIETLRVQTAKVELFRKQLFEARDYFRSIGMDDRMAMNYSVPVAGYCVAFGDKDLDFARWLVKELTRVKLEQDGEGIIDIFFNDLQVLRLSGKVSDKFWDTRDGKIYLYFHGLYNIWADDYRKRKGEPPFKASSIRDYLKDEPGYIEAGVVHRIGSLLTKCATFHYDQAREELKNLVEMVLPGER